MVIDTEHEYIHKEKKKTQSNKYQVPVKSMWNLPGLPVLFVGYLSFIFINWGMVETASMTRPVAFQHTQSLYVVDWSK